jgi:hypothetical protein
VRVVDDPTAPVVARTDFDATHPNRLTEVVAGLNQQVGRKVITAYDVQCMRRLHDIDLKSRFFHKPKFGSPQYSDSFVSWLAEQYRNDPAVFEKAKVAVKSSGSAS